MLYLVTFGLVLSATFSTYLTYLSLQSDRDYVITRSVRVRGTREILFSCQLSSHDHHHC